MTRIQFSEIEQLQNRLEMSPGTLRRLIAEIFPGEACGIRSIAELSQYQAGTLLGKLREIEAAHKPGLVIA